MYTGYLQGYLFPEVHNAASQLVFVLVLEDAVVRPPHDPAERQPRGCEAWSGVPVYIYVYIYVYTYIYIHIYKYTDTYICV